MIELSVIKRDRKPTYRPRRPAAQASNRMMDLEIDEYGAPVTFGPARWLVCFVPGLRHQFWHCLVHRTHKHVLMLKRNADDTWTLFEPWWTRVLVRTIHTDHAVQYLRWAAMGDALLVQEDVPGRGSQFRGWSNCVSLAAFVLGRSYWVWSPNALFRRLLAEDGAQQVDIPALLNRLSATGSQRSTPEITDGWGSLPLRVSTSECAT